MPSFSVMKVSLNMMYDSLLIYCVIIGGQLFSDPSSQIPNDEEELPSNLSDDDDDAKLANNTKAANDMEVPAKLKKPEQKQSVIQRKKGSKQNPVDEPPQTTAQRMEALHNQQATEFVVFPPTIGLSGKVFNTGELIVCNDAEKEPAFVELIDNQPKVRNVKNFMIGPVYEELSPDQPADAHRKPNGII